MSRLERTLADLRQRPRTWLITGVAGFIGSNLLERLLDLDQRVVGVDNFATGHWRNLEQALAGQPSRRDRFRFVEADICELEACREACEGVDYVLHHAALGSVPRSIDDPISTNRTNIDGFLNMLVAARDAGVARFVYAASSSTYGDHPALPKKEEVIGKPLSPYAVTKYVNELYASVFERTYGLESIGLRYFNVFGPRQDPNGAYAAVIPRWIGLLTSGAHCFINGDGQNSRDFCYVKNAVQANLLAATATGPESTNGVYNVACGERTTLNELYFLIRDGLAAYRPDLRHVEPVYQDFRPGDVRHSLADISRIRSGLGYTPTHTVRDGLREALSWYVEHLGVSTR